MTSTSSLPAPTTTPQSAPQSAQPAAGTPRGRGGPRGGPYRGRGGSRGRGNRGNRSGGPQQARQAPPGLPNPHTAPPRPPPDDLGGGVSSQDPTRDAAIGKPTGSGQEGAENDEPEGEVCFICASPVQHHSVAPCNHRTCHICALRLRTLYKTRACAHCRTEAQYLIFTDDPDKRFEDFQETDIRHNDETLGIKYTDNNIHADTIILLRYNCPDQGCDQACLGWPHLHQHVKSVHHKVMCDLCTRNKKVFTHEHELFTPPELRKHERFGDDHPGAVDQSGFRGHPECGFCRTRFYGDDELYTHCRDKHERCHICDRRRQGGNQQYFVNYDSLEQHFRKDHFLCADKDCLDKKFVVFESEMDMKAHQLEQHPNGLTKDARRDARRVDISTFDFRGPQESSRRGRGGRERGRDPNVDPLPQSTAQPLRRDELAYQRQMAINHAHSSTARTFGSQLTPANAPVAAARSRPTTPNTNVVSTSIDSLSLNEASSADLTPQQQARQIAHAALISRASGLLGNDPTKLTTFRSSVSSYKNNSLSASDLITTFFSLFDAPASELGKLINELAELYEDEKKRINLRKSWNDWRAINEDYPSLPNLGPTSASSGIAGGSRVLRLKSSTQNSANMGRPGSQAPRGTQQAPKGWASSAASGLRGPAISSTGSIARVGTTTPWAGSSTAAPPRPNAAATRGRGPAVDAFPALPMARKPNTLISTGMTRGSVRPAWEAGASSTNAVSAWGAGNGSAPIEANTPADGFGGGEGGEDKAAGIAGGKKKGKQGKKEVLYKFG